MKALLFTALAVFPLAAQAAPLPDTERAAITGDVDGRAPALAATARSIWDWAEVGYQENRSSGLLQSELRKAGFTVKAGVAGMPTAFVASFSIGSGPVIAILAEYDALPGMAQTDAPTRQPIAGQIAGHACGHNVFGAASITAAMAVKDWMVANKVAGTIRVYGTPAEEGGSGKVYMVRAGLFDDVSATLHWHPGDGNGVSVGKSQANISGKFRFTGRAAHASAAPWQGRSALDGVEIMDVATNFLREHIPIGTRIHYVITDGGKAPNVVPEKAEVYYYVRHTDPQVVKDVWARVGKAAEGAALASDTKVETEITGGVYSMLGNDTLADVMQRNLVAVGGPVLSAADRKWAETVSKTLQTPKPLDEATRVGPVYRGDGGGSTDVSDVSWTTPTVGMQTATWVPGTPAHSWQAAAASGTPMAAKAGVVAAKTMALTAAELFRSPDTLAAARAEFLKARGPDFKYRAMVGDRAPPLDYRKAGGSE